MLKHPILLACLTLCSAGRAQDYFPLKDGNAWHYSSKSLGFGTDGPRESFALKVIGDTVTTDGKSYSVLDRTGFFQTKFLRLESGSIFGLIDGRDSLVLDTDELPDDSIRYGCALRPISVSEETILGIPQTVKTFGNPGCFALGVTLKLARTFGIVEFRFSPELAPETVDKLEFAILDGQTFGNPAAVSRLGHQSLKSNPALRHFNGSWIFSKDKGRFTVLGKIQP